MPPLPDDEEARRRAKIEADIKANEEAARARNAARLATAKNLETFNPPVLGPSPIRSGARYEEPDLTAGSPEPEKRYIPPVDDPIRDAPGIVASPMWDPSLAIPAARDGSGIFGVGSGGPEDPVPGPLTEAQVIELKQWKDNRDAGVQSFEMRSRLMDGADPEAAARALELSQRTGASRLEVQSDPEGYSRLDLMSQVDKLRETSPRTLTWLNAYPDNFDIAHDDTESLSWWDSISKSFGDAFARTDALKAERGRRDGAGMGALTEYPLASDLRPGVADAQGVAYGAAVTGGALKSGFATTTSGIYGVARSASELNDQFASWVAGRKLESVPSQWLAERQQAAKISADEWMPKVDDPTLQGALQGIQSLPTSAFTIATAMMTGGSSIAGAAVAGGVTAGDEYGTAREQGMDPLSSAGYGTTQGILEAAWEVPQLKFLIGDMNKQTPFGEMLFKQALVQGVTEQGATHTQDFVSWALLPANRDKTIDDYIAERPAAAYQTLIASMVGTGVQTTTAKLLNEGLKAIDEGYAQKRAEEIARFVDKSLDNGANSKLLKRHADKYREAVAAVSDVSYRVDSDAFNELAQEQGVSVAQLAQAFRIDPAEAQSAIDGGQEVVIPAGNYVAGIQYAKKEIGIGGEAIHAALGPNIRLKPGDPTQREKEIDRAIAESMEAQQQEPGFADAADRVIEDSRKILADTKRYNAETTANLSRVKAELIITLAERTNQDPEKLWADYKASVESKIKADEDELSQGGDRAAVEVDDDTLQRASERLTEYEFAVWKAATLEGRTNSDIADDPAIEELRLKQYVTRSEKDAMPSREGISVVLNRARNKGFSAPEAKRGRGDAIKDDVKRLIKLGLTSKQIHERLGRPAELRNSTNAQVSKIKKEMREAGELAQSVRPRLIVEDATVLRAAEELSERQFEAWKGAVIDGLTDSDIAARMDLTPGAVATHLKRAADKGFFVPASERRIDQTTQRIIQLKADGLSNSVIAERIFSELPTEQGKSRVKQAVIRHRQEISELAQDQTENRGGFTGMNLSQEAVIRLYESANLSTFVHETAHWYLTTLEKMARVGAVAASAGSGTLSPEFQRAQNLLDAIDAGGVASNPILVNNIARSLGLTISADARMAETIEKIRAAVSRESAKFADAAEPQSRVHPFVIEQLASIRNWAGKHPEFEIYDANGQITEEGVEVQEAFAETFEAYLREGKAPSTAMRSVFAAFKSWLMRVYRSIVEIGGRVRLNDEIRSVFDRALATDEAIAAVRKGMDKNAEQMAKAMLDKGVITQRQYERTKARLVEAKEKAEADLMARLMEQYERNQKVWWREEERDIRRDVQSEIDERPEQRAYQVFTGEGWRDTLEDHVEAAIREAELAQNRFDLDTREARAEWVAENTVDDVIPGEATDSRQYGFALSNGTNIVVQLIPQLNGETEIHWTFLSRLKDRADETGVYAKGQESFTADDVLEMMPRIAAIVETDMAKMGRDGYSFTSIRRSVRNMNARLVRLLEGTDYEIVEFPGQDDPLLIHRDADVAENGKILPRPENRGRKFEWDGTEDPEGYADAFYEKVSALEPGGPAGRRDGGRSISQDGREAELGQYRGIPVRTPEFDGPGMLRKLLGEPSKYLPWHHNKSYKALAAKAGKKVEEVAVAKIVPGQPQIRWNFREIPARYGTKDEDLPILIRENGVYYINDGTHRIAAQVDAGATSVRAQVIDLDAVAQRGREVIVLSDRVFSPGQPDDLGFITSAERALANPPPRFRDAKELTADQWRKLFQQGGATKEAFTYQIEPAIKVLAAAGVTGDIPKAKMEEALARVRGTLRSPPEKSEVFGPTGVRMQDRTEADYSVYVAPGSAKNYRQEVLLLPPEQGQGYKSHNWNSEGVVGHIRTTDRVATDGGKVRHVEELQSDLHQEGARSGYRGEAGGAEQTSRTAKQARDDFSDAIERFTVWKESLPADERNRLPYTFDRNFRKRPPDEPITDPTGRELYRELQAKWDLAKAAQDGIKGGTSPPRAPMENWEEPFVRHALQQAAADGIDTVTFPTHATLHSALQNEGTKKFYDERLPNTLVRVAKSLGLKVEQVTLDMGKVRRRADGLEDIVPVDARGQQTVPAIRLTPEAKAKLALGVEMYQTRTRPGRIAPPPSVPPMRLDLRAVEEQYGPEALAALPPKVRAHSASATDADQFVQLARDVQATLKKKAPRSLSTFLARKRTIGEGNDKITYSGIRDSDGEILAMIGKRGEARGLIATPENDSKKSRSYSYEEAAQAAWEEGYFNGESPPDIAEFLDALRSDLDGTAKLYRSMDQGVIQQIDSANEWANWFDQNEIDINEENDAVLRAAIETKLSSQGEGAIGPDEAAPFFKMPDGRALLEGLKHGPQRDKLIREETRRRMIERHGDIFNDGTIMQQAEVFARNEVQQRQYEIELEALSNASGKQAAANLARETAKELLRDKQVREVLNYNQWLILSERWGKKALEAAEKGDFAKAAEFKRFQIINMAVFREARKLAEKIEKAVKHAKSFDGRDKRIRIGKAGKDYLQQIDQILEGYEFKPVTRKREQERVELRDWFATKQATLDPMFDPTGLSEEEMMAVEMERAERSAALAAMQADANVRNYKSLTTEELMAVRDQLDMIERTARRENALLVEGERRNINLAIDDIEAQAIIATPKELPPESYASYSPKEKRKRGIKQFFSEIRTMQAIVRIIDGIDNGPLAKNTIHKLNTAGAMRSARMKLEEDKVVALFRKAYGIDLKVLRQDPIRFPGIDVPLAKMERLTIALYWGTEISRKRIMDGYGWDAATVQSVLNSLDQTDWDFVKSVWDYVGSLYPEHSEAHQDVHGVPLSKQPGLPIVTRYGVIDGSYFPIKYNPHQSSRADQQALTDTAKQITGRAGTRKATGSTKERVKGKVTMPVLLDFYHTLAFHVNEVVDNITMQRAVLDAGRIIAHPRTQQIIVKRHGWVTYKTLMSAMKDTRNGLAAPNGPTEQIAVRIRNGATNVTLGLNIGTVIKQLIGFTATSVRLGGPRSGAIGGLGWMLRGAVRMGFGARGMQNGVAFILERSPYMRVRMEVMNQAIADQQRRINEGNIKADLKRGIDIASFFMIQRVQFLAIDSPTWLGAYEKFTASGMSEKDAAASADQVVIDAQGSGELWQVSAFQRGGPIQRIFTNYITAAVANWNLAVNQTKQTNFRNPGQAAIWAMNMGVLMTVPVILSMAVAHMMSPGGDDDDEPLEEQYIREQISFLLGPLGLFGQMSGAAAGFAYKGPQGTRWFQEASKVITETFTGAEKLLAGEATADDAIDILRPANMAAGVWLGYPAAALDRFVRGAWALAEGDTQDPKALIAGPPRE